MQHPNERSWFLLWKERDAVCTPKIGKKLNVPREYSILNAPCDARSSFNIASMTSLQTVDYTVREKQAQKYMAKPHTEYSLAKFTALTLRAQHCDQMWPIYSTVSLVTKICMAVCKVLNRLQSNIISRREMWLNFFPNFEPYTAHVHNVLEVKFPPSLQLSMRKWQVWKTVIFTSRQDKWLNFSPILSPIQHMYTMYLKWNLLQVYS